MRQRKRTNLLLGVILAAAAVIVLLRSLEVLPLGPADIAARAWPALLIFVGLASLLAQRMAFGRLLALIISAGLVVGVAFAAYSSQSGELKTDQRINLEELVPDMDLSGVTLLEIGLETLATDVELLSSDSPEPRITGEFVGSLASSISATFTVQPDGRASFILREEREEQLPPLDAVGRGRLSLQIPANIALAFAFRGDDGDILFNMSDLSLERLTIDLARGDVVVTLPEYAPLSPNAAEQPGVITAGSGDVTLFIPQTVAARLELNRQGSGIAPQFDDNVYRYLQGDVLEARTFEEPDAIQIRYILNVGRGLIRIETASN